MRLLDYCEADFRQTSRLPDFPLGGQAIMRGISCVTTRNFRGISERTLVTSLGVRDLECSLLETKLKATVSSVND